MKIIDKTQVLGWLSKRNLLDNGTDPKVSDFTFLHSFKISNDSGTKTNLSRELFALVANCSSESLLWIDEYGIWPSCEDFNLFDGFRMSLGEIEPLHVKPGHLFRAEDINTIQSIIAMVLYFVWGAFIVTGSKDIIVRISHDEFIDIYLKEDIDVSCIKKLCETVK